MPMPASVKVIVLAGVVGRNADLEGCIGLEDLCAGRLKNLSFSVASQRSR
jgi:hypothetical protein